MLTEELEAHEYAYLTTTGRATGKPHRIEIWFVVIDGSVWVASGGGNRSDWVRNLAAEPKLRLEIGTRGWPARATLHHDLAAHRARELLAARYQGWTGDEPLSDWATTALLIEVTVVPD